jgi:FKBP-type peptidyl-prolyl cis-trans isomerase FklB
MKLKLDVLLITTLTALSAVAQPNNPAGPRPNPQMPPGLMRGPAANEPPPKMPDKDTLSYFIGMSVGRSIRKQNLPVDVDTIAAAIRDVITDKPTKFSDSQYMAIQKELTGALRAKAMEERKVQEEKIAKEGAENKAKGETFLAKNMSEPGIKTLTNGIQYKVIKDGNGVTPGPHDNVTIKYKGSLIDGSVFDQNDKYPTAVTGRTIRGWSAVMQQMKVGSEWQVFIPPDMAYGLHSPTPKIPPDSVLVFDMELLSDAPPAPPAGARASARPISVTSSAAPAASPGGPPTPVVSGQIIKVPSAEELKKGAKIEVITNAPSQ